MKIQINLKIEIFNSQKTMFSEPKKSGIFQAFKTFSFEDFQLLAIRGMAS